MCGILAALTADIKKSNFCEALEKLHHGTVPNPTF